MKERNTIAMYSLHPLASPILTHHVKAYYAYDGILTRFRWRSGLQRVRVTALYQCGSRIKGARARKDLTPPFCTSTERRLRGLSEQAPRAPTQDGTAVFQTKSPPDHDHDHDHEIPHHRMGGGGGRSYEINTSCTTMLSTVHSILTLELFNLLPWTYSSDMQRRKDCSWSIESCSQQVAFPCVPLLVPCPPRVAPKNWPKLSAVNL